MSISYPDWLESVRRTVRARRPDIDPKLIDPNAAYQAYVAGISSVDFATQPYLPLMPAPPRSNTRLIVVVLAIVCSVLVLLAAMSFVLAALVPRQIGRTDDPKVVTAKSNIGSLHSLVEQFRLDCNRYPTTQEGLNALVTQPPNLKNWHGPYIDRGKLTDPWDNAYVYQYPNPNGTSPYLLESYGADGAPGGDGVSADIIDGQEQ